MSAGRLAGGLFLQGMFLLGMGAGVLAVAWSGWQSGVLPAGTNFFRAFRPTREDNPLAFHVFFALYLCGGIVLAAWGLLSLAGMAEPLKLR